MEEEKASLLTAIRLLRDDLKTSTSQSTTTTAVIIPDESESNFKQVTGKKRRSKKLKGMSNPAHNANGSGHVPKEKIVAPQSKEKDKQSSKAKSPIGQNQSLPNSSDGPSPTTTVIIGDSMIKNVHGWKLGNE